MIICKVALLVLIETLWNVKLLTAPELGHTARINRNIVECKVAHKLYAWEKI